MPRGKYESVAIGPLGVMRIVPEVPVPKYIRHSGRTHGHSRMSGVRFLDAVHRECADGIDRQSIEIVGDQRGLLRKVANNRLGTFEEIFKGALVPSKRPENAKSGPCSHDYRVQGRTSMIQTGQPGCQGLFAVGSILYEYAMSTLAFRIALTEQYLVVDNSMDRSTSSFLISSP